MLAFINKVEAGSNMKLRNGAQILRQFPVITRDYNNILAYTHSDETWLWVVFQLSTQKSSAHSPKNPKADLDKYLCNILW